MQNVEFDISWSCDAEKVPAIRVLRQATGCGLKEAKYAVEGAGDKWVTWRLTVEQFGAFMALRWQGDHGFSLADVKLLDAIESTTVDFTQGSHGFI